jgi:hypothetical protein
MPNWIERLIASLAPVSGSTVSLDQHPDAIPTKGPLKIRIYDDGRLTLNGAKVSRTDLKQPLKEAAAKERAVWIYVERSDPKQDPLFCTVARELVQADKGGFWFSKRENFADLPGAATDDEVWPLDMFCYTDAETRKYVANQKQIMTYLSKLEADVRWSLDDKNAKGAFLVFVAIRPNSSKIWLLPPEDYPPDDASRLRQQLETRKTPEISGGVVAFALSVQVPRPEASRQWPGTQWSDTPAPKEWTDVPKRLRRSMSVPEILDVIWPPNPPKDDAQAVSLCWKAADQGLALAQCALGIMYQNGRGVVKDDAQAAAWWRNAADQGDAVAQLSLGWMYANGLGVPKDGVRALAWIREAAKQGNATAQAVLERWEGVA